MDIGLLVLVPPALVLILALTLRNVTISLLFGIAAAALLATNFALWPGIKLAMTTLLNESGIPDLIYRTGSYDRILMFGFLAILGVLIELLTHTGGLRVFTKAISKRVHSQKGAQFAPLMLSGCFFIDDYFNALMVGSIVRPITDHFRVPRAKLAYLLNAVTSPMAVVIPASSWVGMILSQFEASGVTRTLVQSSLIVIDPFHLYLNIIPFLFYPLLSILTAWFTVSSGMSYGLMHKFEVEADKTGNLFGGKQPLAHRSEELTHSGTAKDILVPMVTFITLCIGMLLYSGGYILFGGTKTFFAAFMSGNNVLSLFTASLFATLISCVTSLIKKQLTIKKIGELAKVGFNLMQSSIVVLWLAWALSALLENDLHTGQVIAPLLLKTLNISLVPLIIFFVSTLVSVSTGSSWGTISFLMPLALPLMANLLGHPPLTEAYANLLAPVIAAVISGAVAGCQLSPITDATIMASTSAVCYHTDHAQTQASYSMAPLLGAIVAFLCTGLFFRSSYLMATLFSLAIGLTSCIAFIYIRKSLRK